MTTGHFFAHFQGEPHFNMGFDEWLLSEAFDRPGYFAVRLYTWKPGAITFGYNQRHETALDWPHLGETPAIRRVTGGRALYHDPSELTYSVVVNQQDLPVEQLAGSQADSTRLIAETLVLFLSKLGVDTGYIRRSSPENGRPTFFHKAPCFASAAKWEVTRGSEKIIASAQRRHSGCLLQHGSIKLAGLAPHPALAGLSGEANDPLPACPEDRFEQCRTLLRSTFSTQTGILFKDCKLAVPQILHLEEMVARVKKNPLGRREIIKRTAQANSL